ncbi:MAG: OsmC family protein [Geodermatophilaceae bacterium]|nr:OsmC family protein [Geodermatophilaceae bacterium]
MTATHRYRSDLAWAGSTGVGYRDYDRGHRLRTPPAELELALSSDPHFRGDPRRTNPEQLLLAAASSCQLLSFLALAARAGIDVTAYADHAEAEMPVVAAAMRITRVVLRPHIVVAAGTDLGRVRSLVDEAHGSCYVANTLNAEMVIEATITEATA